MSTSQRAKALPHPDRRGQLPAACCRHPKKGERPKKTERPQRFPQREQHPITIMSPTIRSSTEISLGTRAHDRCCHTTRNHSPPTTDRALDGEAPHR